MNLFSRTDKSFLGQWWWTVDRPMLVAFFLLMAFGAILVTTASPPVAESHGWETYHFLKKHLFLLPFTAIILVGMSMMPPRLIWRVASIVFVGAILAMVLVLFVGTEIKGAQRWIRVLGFSLQPSEFVKPAFAIVAAWFMSWQKEKENFPGNAIAAGLYFITVCLLLLQPDMGMTLVLTCIWASQIFLAGFPFRLLIGFGGMAAMGGVSAYFLFDHVHSRVNRFLFPESGDTYQVDRSLDAFQNGGLFGTGPGQGTVKQTLPDAHADFIFPVAGEEMGLVFVLLIIAVFSFVVLRGLKRLADSDSMFSVLAVGGILTMFGLQALVHMGSSMNVLPAKGMTLPFISYGGSSILAMGFAMGAVLALTRRQARRSIAQGGLSRRTKKTGMSQRA